VEDRVKRYLTKFDEVLAAVGGFAALAQLTGETRSAVSRWREAGRFPGSTMLCVEAELARKGAVAAVHLWDFDPPRTYEDDKRATKRA
jgi:hypothetical protein